MTDKNMVDDIKKSTEALNSRITTVEQKIKKLQHDKEETSRNLQKVEVV